MKKVKLIIELDEDKYNYIKKYGTISMCYDYKITSAILNGTPLEELKGENNEWNISQEQAKMLLQIIVALKLGTPEEAEILLRTYIDELKGE